MGLLLFVLLGLSSLSSPAERQAANSFYYTQVLAYAGDKETHYYFPQTRTGLDFRTGKVGDVRYALGSYYFHPTLYEQRVFFGVINGKFTLFVWDLSTEWDGTPKPIKR